MNEIESMRYFQDLYDRFADKPGEVYWARVHNQTTREAIETALTSLREQAERSKGCEYCKDLQYMPFAEHKVYIDGNGKLDVDGDEDFQLNFCPMCGKRLEVEP